MAQGDAINSAHAAFQVRQPRGANAAPPDELWRLIQAFSV